MSRVQGADGRAGAPSLPGQETIHGHHVTKVLFPPGLQLNHAQGGTSRRSLPTLDILGLCGWADTEGQISKVSQLGLLLSLRAECPVGM